jgi:hypothetical protein
VTCLRRGQDLAESPGNRWRAATANELLGDTLHRAGQLDAARESWGTALATYEELGSADSPSLRAKLLAS